MSDQKKQHVFYCISFFAVCAKSCAKCEKAWKYRVFRDEARHGKAFEGLLNRYFG